MAKVIVIPVCTPEVNPTKYATSLNVQHRSPSLTSTGRSRSSRWGADSPAHAAKPATEVRTPAVCDTPPVVTGRSLREVEEPVTEDALVAKYRQMLAGSNGGLYLSDARRSSRTDTRIATSTHPPARLSRWVASSPQQYRSAAIIAAADASAAETNRRLSTAKSLPTTATLEGTTFSRPRRVSSASWSNRKLQLRDSGGRRPETALGYRLQQPRACDETQDADDAQDRRLNSAATTSRRKWKVAFAVSSAALAMSRYAARKHDNEFIIDGDDDNDDVDSGFNRDESSTRDSSRATSLLQGDEATMRKEQDEQQQPRQLVEGESSIPDTDKTESVAQRDRSLPVADDTTGSGHDSNATAMTNDRRMLMTAGRGFSFTSPEARRAFGEIWSDMERQRPSQDSSPPSDSASPSRIDQDTDPTSGARGGPVGSRAQPPVGSSDPVSDNAVQRDQQKSTMVSRQRVKHGLISASLTSTVSSPVSRQYNASVTTRRRPTSSLPRRAHEHHVFDETSCNPTRQTPSTDAAPLNSAGRRSTTANPRRRAMTVSGPTTSSSSSSCVASQRRNDRLRSSPSAVDKHVNDDDPFGESSSGKLSDFHITSSTYDSRYADMMAAAALDELWRQRGGGLAIGPGLGRWNERSDPAVDGTVDPLIRELAVAKCMAWLTKQDQPPPYRRRSIFN
jgi:hypothetical protein